MIATTLTQPTAYHKWLYSKANGNVSALELLVTEQVLSCNMQAFELIELTGDKYYTTDTMNKAARLVLDMCGEVKNQLS